jgi:hypothetical protein
MKVKRSKPGLETDDVVRMKKILLLGPQARSFRLLDH